MKKLIYLFALISSFLWSNEATNETTSIVDVNLDLTSTDYDHVELTDTNELTFKYLHPSQQTTNTTSTGSNTQVSASLGNFITSSLGFIRSGSRITSVTNPYLYLPVASSTAVIVSTVATIYPSSISVNPVLLTIVTFMTGYLSNIAFGSNLAASRKFSRDIGTLT